MRSGYCREVDSFFQTLYDSVCVGMAIKKFNESGIRPGLFDIAASLPKFEHDRTFSALDVLEYLGLVKSIIEKGQDSDFHGFFLSEHGRYMLSETGDGEII